MARWPSDWRSIPIAGIINKPGTSMENYTGTWRALKPVADLSKCIKCLMCWVSCPDNSIIRRDDDYIEVDYRYCKGCGICSEVCPTKAIEMVEEGM